MKKIALILNLAGMIFLFNACSPGYVREEPTYRVGVRPERPGENYIWRDNEWVWKRNEHAYQQRDGQWVKPNRGRTFKQGHWKNTPRGKQWKKGHWE